MFASNWPSKRYTSRAYNQSDLPGTVPRPSQMSTLAYIVDILAVLRNVLVISLLSFIITGFDFSTVKYVMFTNCLQI